jgi:SAM-dependent methyltransferase
MSNAPCLADILTALGVLVNKPTTIDPAEQARFERLAKLWWDKSGPFWPLHGMNELRAGYIRDQISHWRENQADADRQLNGLRILDIGCGGGILSEAIARMGAEVHGVDMVEKNIKIARSHAAEQGLKLSMNAAPPRLWLSEERSTTLFSIWKSWSMWPICPCSCEAVPDC